MKKLVAGLLCVLLFATVSFAELKIPKNQRIRNFPSGCCVWCSLENLGNVHDIKSLKGIAQYRHENYSRKKYCIKPHYEYGPWGPIYVEEQTICVNEAMGSAERVKHEMARLKVKYKMQTQWNYDLDIINESVKDNLGCAIGIFNYPRWGDYHMVTLTDLNDKECIFVDNNEDCPRMTAPRQWFNEHWTGFTIIVYPNKN